MSDCRIGTWFAAGAACLGVVACSQFQLARGQDRLLLDPPPAFLGGDAGQPATTTLVDLQARVAAYRQRLVGLDVTYRADLRGPGGRDPYPGEYLRRRVVALDRRRYLRTLTLRSAEDGREEVLHDMHQFYGPDFWDVYAPGSRRYETSKRFTEHPSTIKALGEVYLETIAWFPPGDTSKPLVQFGRAFFPTELLAREKCRLVPYRQVIDGESCHGFEVPGLDRLWFADADGSLKLRLRAYPGSGKPYLGYRLTDHREVAPGVRLPFCVVVVEYDEETGKARRWMKYSVDQASANDIDEAVFRFTPGPGTMVYDRDTDQLEVVPGGLDYLDEVARQSIALCPTRAPPRTLRSLRFNFCLAALIGLAATLAGSVAVDWVTRSQRPPAGIPGGSQRPSVDLTARCEAAKEGQPGP
jgi:hypothetical protein